MIKAIDRLYEYLEYKGIKPTNLEREIQLSNGYFSIQRKRKADIGETALKKITDYCRDLNPTWLLTGNGEMLLDSKGMGLNKYAKTARDNADLESKTFTWLVFSMYQKKKGNNFSFDSFMKLKEFFDLASAHTSLLQTALEVDIYSDVLKTIKDNPQFNSEGDYVIPESLALSIDKYAEVFEKIEKIAGELINILLDPAIQKEIIGYVKNK